MTVDTNMRQQFIITKTHLIERILRFLKEKNKRFSPTWALSNEANISGGSFTILLADLKILGLVNNGDGIEISDIGREFLRADSFEGRRSFFLRVPLFQQMHLNGIKSILGARDYLKNVLKEAYQNPTTLTLMVNQSSLRYMENVVGTEDSGKNISRVISVPIEPISNEEDTIRLTIRLKKIIEEFGEGRTKKVLGIIIDEAKK